MILLFPCFPLTLELEHYPSLSLDPPSRITATFIFFFLERFTYFPAGLSFPCLPFLTRFFVFNLLVNVIVFPSPLEHCLHSFLYPPCSPFLGLHATYNGIRFYVVVLFPIQR